MKIHDPGKREAFQLTGVKTHRLYQADNAILFITELPSEVAYTYDFFQWRASMASILPEADLKSLVLFLSNSDEIIIDYDQRQFYKRAEEKPRASKMVAGHIADVYKFGPQEEEQGYY